MEHGGRISCCKNLVVAPWQGRRHWRGRGAADPPPFLGQISEPKSYKMGVDFAHQVSRPLGLPDLPMALRGGGGLEKHYCWGCSFSQKKWIPSHATVVNNSRHIAIDTHLFTAIVWSEKKGIQCLLLFQYNYIAKLYFSDTFYSQLWTFWKI